MTTCDPPSRYNPSLAFHNHTRLVADSCHSGTVARFAPIQTPPAVRGAAPPRRAVRFLPPGAFLSRRAADRLGRRGDRRTASPPGRQAGSSSRMPGYRIQLRRLVPRAPQRSVHVRRPPGTLSPAGPRHLPSLVRAHPRGAPLPAVSAVAEPLRLGRDEAVDRAGLTGGTLRRGPSVRVHVRDWRELDPTGRPGQTSCRDRSLPLERWGPTLDTSRSARRPRRPICEDREQPEPRDGLPDAARGSSAS